MVAGGSHALAPQAGRDLQEQHGWLLVIPQKGAFGMKGKVFLNPRGFSKGVRWVGTLPSSPSSLAEAGFLGGAVRRGAAITLTP